MSHPPDDNLDATIDQVLEDFLETGIVTIVGERNGEFVWALTDYGKSLAEEQIREILDELYERREDR